MDMRSVRKLNISSGVGADGLVLVLEQYRGLGKGLQCGVGM